MTSVPPPEGYPAQYPQPPGYPQPGMYPQPAGYGPGYLAVPPAGKRGLSRPAIVWIVVAAVVILGGIGYLAVTSGKDKVISSAAQGDWNCTSTNRYGDSSQFDLLVRDGVFAIRLHDNYYGDEVAGGTWSIENGNLNIVVEHSTYGVDNFPDSWRGHLAGIITETYGDSDTANLASFNADLSSGRIQVTTEDGDTYTCTKR